MSSYLSNLLTQTTSRYNSLRRTLLSNEDDGDTEDDSHISRVLRAYYTEKGRPFPPWLPPDPNDRRAITPQQSAYGNVGSSYFPGTAGRSQVAGVQAQGQASQRSSLSDLWDSPANGASAQQPQSLRPARRPMAPTSVSTLAPPQARPLPSQRAGSYQSVASQQGGRPPAQPSMPSTGGSTAQDRLKARLWGGRGSPQPSPGLSQVGSANPYDQPNMGSNQPWSSEQGQYDGEAHGGSARRYGR